MNRHVRQATTTPYVPAAGRAALTRLYDPALALTMRETRFRGLLLEQVSRALPAGGDLIDVGAGTGTFALQFARIRSDARVIAVDGDERVLALARRKIDSGMVTWMRGLAGSLPLEDASADAVVMSLLLHHLSPDGKVQALQEARRVLRPEGTLHIADWGRPHGPVMRTAFLLLQALDGFDNTRDHAAGRLPVFLANAGFECVETSSRLRTVWGSLEILRAA